jgi:ComF family protein
MIPALEDPRLVKKIFDAVVPVPLHPLREREREFNQSDLLARSLAKQLGLPLLRLLKRNISTAPQAGFDRAGRLENLRGAFSLRGRVPVDATILLIDDVATTGATLDACASLLMEGGATDVSALTLARG